MNFRGAIAALFGGVKRKQNTSLWWDVNGYNSVFSPFNTDLYANDVARSSIHTLAEHTSKANAIARQDPRLERMMRLRPNLYMNGKDFLYKCRTLLEINNTCFIFINRDDAGKCIGLYPMPACQSEAVESAGELFIKFWLQEPLVLPWADLAVLRKHYNKSDIIGDTNAAITTGIDLLKTTSEGMGNAIKSTANLRGILKSTKAMLSDDDVKKQKDRFVADYLSFGKFIRHCDAGFHCGLQARGCEAGDCHLMSISGNSGRTSTATLVYQKRLSKANYSAINGRPFMMLQLSRS